MQYFEFDIITIIDFLALVQGVILGIVLITGSHQNRPSLFLGLFLFIYSIELVDTILYDSFFYDENPQWLMLPLNFYFLAVPLLYLYTKSLIQPVKLQKHIGILIPGIIEFFILLTLFLLPIKMKEEIMYNTKASTIHNISSLIFSIYWVFRILRLIQNHQKEVENFYSQIYGKRLTWVKSVSIFMVFYYTLWLFEPIMSENFYYSFAQPFLTIINMLFIYWVAISGIRQFAIPTLYYQQQEQQYESDKTKSIIKNDVSNSMEQGNNNSDESKQSNESPKPNPKFEAIITQIQAEKLYTDADLNLQILSRKVAISSRELSQLINQEAGVNFNLFINKYRIEEAKKLLINPKFDHFTILSVAYEVGFNSKATFYSMFKKLTKTTPTKFKNQYK